MKILRSTKIKKATSGHNNVTVEKLKADPAIIVDIQMSATSNLRRTKTISSTTSTEIWRKTEWPPNPWM
jgi:hypothetical protein